MAQIKSIENKQGITASLEDYLKAIYFLHQKDKAVRLIDIAERMSVSKPSVCNAVSQLLDLCLIKHEKFGPILLTDHGLETAKSLVSKYEIIKLFLIRVLNVEEPLANREACAMEHEICDATVAKMALLI